MTQTLTGAIACRYSPNCKDSLCPYVHGDETPTIEDLQYKCTQLHNRLRTANHRLRERETQLFEVKAQLTALQTAINPTPQQQWTPPPQQWTPPPQQWTPPPQQWTQNHHPQGRLDFWGGAPNVASKGKGKGSSNRSRSCAGR